MSSDLKDFDFDDLFDDDLEKEVEDHFDQDKKYHELLSNIVDESFDFLMRKRSYDNRGKKSFAIGISIFCAVQYIIIIALILLMNTLSIPALVMEILVTGILAETFALITIMVKALFNNRADLEVIKAIQEVAAGYKKSKSTDDSNEKNRN